MKKLLAFVLAVGLAVSTGVTAFAEDATTTTNDGTQNTEITVNGSYQASTPAGSNISVDIVWDDMSFTYTGESKDAWDPKTHTYSKNTPAHWSWSDPDETGKTAPAITLTNHSDTDVKAKFAFNSSVTGLNGTFTGVGDTTLTDNALTLPTAFGTTRENAPNAAVSFSVDGSGIESDQRLGSIVVTVAKDGPDTPDTPQETVAVSSETELKEAIAAGKSVKLTSSLTLTDTLDLGTYSGTIDLNSQTLTFGNHAYVKVFPDNGDTGSANVTINNGTIQSNCEAGAIVLIDRESNIRMNNCIIKNESADAAAVQVNGGTVVLNSCTLASNSPTALRVHIANLTLSGTTKITATDSTESPIFILNTQYNPTCLAGTYNFDPTDYVDTGKYTITESNGTWTVAENTSGGDTSTDQVTVTTFEQLENAISTAQNSKTIKLGADIETAQQLVLQSSANIVIDFDNHTLTSSANTAISNRSNLTLKNGTLAGTGYATTLITDDNSSLIAEGMTITSENSYALNPMRSVKAELTNCTLTTQSTNTAAVFLQEADATLNSCTVESKIPNAILLTGGFADSSDTTRPSTPPGATLTISEGTTVNGKIEIDSYSVPCTIVVQEGCTFNPEEHYDSSKATLTNDGNGTWTITAGTTGGDGDVFEVGTVEELEPATGYPESRLMTDLTVEDNLLWAGFGSTFDLNGKTLTLENDHTFTLEYGDIGSLNNGTIKGRLIISDTNELTMNDCTVETNEGCALEISAFDGFSSSVTLNNCALHSPKSSTTLRIGGNVTVTLSGNTTIASNGVEGEMINLNSATLICLAGTYNFDPTAYVDKTAYTITSDGSGTWTVTAGTTGGDTTGA